MKDRALIGLSFAFSIAALGYSIRIHSQAEKFAADALRNREVEFVANYAPKVRAFYSGWTGNTNAYPTDPKTIEELFRPMVEIMNQLGGTGDTNPVASPPMMQIDQSRAASLSLKAKRDH